MNNTKTTTVNGNNKDGGIFELQATCYAKSNHIEKLNIISFKRQSLDMEECDRDIELTFGLTEQEESCSTDATQNPSSELDSSATVVDILNPAGINIEHTNKKLVPRPPRQISSPHNIDFNRTSTSPPGRKYVGEWELFHTIGEGSVK